MAVTTLLPDSSVESVKLAVRSTTTCSAATVLTLQTLFRGPAKSSSGTSITAVRHNNSKTLNTSTSTTRTKTSRTTSKTKEAAITALTETDAARLSHQEKLVLATEVFNTTLKTLSDEVRVQSSKSTAPRVRPAQPPSPNPDPASSRKLKRSQSTTPEIQDGDSGLAGVAECATLALACLRTLKSGQGDQEKGAPNVQLEQGACVLAGRFLSLGLNDLAYKELRGLKRRVQQYLDSRATARKKRTDDVTEEDTAKERMSDLLTFTNVDKAGPIIGTVVSFQSNALRLIASEKKLSTTQKLLPALQLSNHSSPAAVIFSAMEADALAKDKAALQLQLLSNTLLSLCSASQSSTTTSSTRPITSLTLQLLSLETRCSSWKLSGHKCDEVKEMWDPLARYLASYAHHSKGIEKSEFASVYTTIVRLQNAVSNTPKHPTDTPKDNLCVARIATVLGQLAQEAGCLKEALKLFTESLGPLSTGQSIGLATVHCKISLLHFHALKSSKAYDQETVAKSLSKATAALGMQLKGNTNDLDELLVATTKLKKLAMAWFGEAITGKHEAKLQDSPIASRIYDYLPGFLKFLRRYLGRQPSVDEEPKEYELFAKRVSGSRNIVLAAVDSTVAVGKVSVMSQQPSWEHMLPALTDCQRLLVAVNLCEDEQIECSVVEQIGMGFVKLSNVFWSRYIKEKEKGKSYRELVPLLKQSANLLSGCSTSQRSSGFAALKFERLAHAYLEGNLTLEAGQAFFQSIQEHIATGALDQTIEETAGSFPQRFGQDPTNIGFMLGRVLSMFLRMSLRSKTSKLPNVFDDESLDSLQRGHILEWQMGILMELQSHGGEVSRSKLTPLLTTLVDVYSPDVHPIRRRRVILSALRFSLEHPHSLEPSLLQELTLEVSDHQVFDEHHGDDSDLACYVTYLKNSLCLTSGLRRGDLGPEQLENIISSWQGMMQNCRDRSSLDLYVGDVDYCLLQMKAVVDYTEIHGLWKLQLSALELVLRITELQETKDFSEGIVILSRLVLQYCRLGYCKRASGLLSRADQCIASNEVSCLAVLSYKLAQVCYLLETGDISKAADILAAAQGLYEKNQGKQDLSNCSVLSKVAWERLVADAAFLSSQLAFAQGMIKDALFFAKLSVRLNCRIWAKVEKIAQRKQERIAPANDSPELEVVVEGMAKLDVTQKTSTSPESYSQGAPFWPHIGSHNIALMNLASLSAHHGLFQDAIYYGEQALKINQTLNANVRLIASQAQLGSHWIFGGHVKEGQELLAAAEGLSRQLESSVELVSLQMGLASLHRAQGNHVDELSALQEADRVMNEFVKSETSGPGVSDLAEKLDNMRIQETTRRTRSTTTTSRPTTRRTRGTMQSAKTAPVVSPTTPSTESESLLHLKSDILRQQAACSRSLRDFERASCLLNDARKLASSRDTQISLNIGESEHLLADAIRHFASHSVYCVLPESTISLPSLESPKPGKSSQGTSSTRETSTRRTRAPTKGSRSRTQKATEDFSVMLSKAGDCLNNVFPTATALGSTLDSHAASRLMSRISMLFHTTAADCTLPWSQSPANVNELGRIGAFAREHVAIDIDKQLTDHCDPLDWPTSGSSATDGDSLCADLTKEYVDILPENWNVLSLSLSADRTEFVVSRLHQGRTPFLLRLPLKRGNSDDDEEQFTFEDGRQEMQELIQLANESAHAAKAQIDRQSKKQWWKNREQLDRRMENLLQNIETVWFGGFRGIFSPVPHDIAPLARFADAFHNVLDKHLPSRQKGGRASSPRLTLHPNVLELFIGVKDLEDHEDPEDTLMDLLYFVVDILQFQGERNAYDEIDFDMMVVETLDALRGYHEAVQNEDGKQAPNHTVLVLDKALHLFPWESLPCLQGFPVCRVPSLECLRDRVLQFRNERITKGGQGLRLNRNKGTYILNPTGDLQTTQGLFEKDLSRLDSWTGIVNRPPTEEEFQDGLESKDLFLYFGHGSGAQYIRGRTVKRLDRCAVTFLMGCSSGALTEAGEYEPYGTPMNYLHAGSASLVATLWDVTDKDIDRFAKSTFEHWGLLGGSDAEASQGGRRSATREVALDEAVSRSRSACVLKYLNGAAPVIYGIPAVFLE
ncbi:C50 family peptidase [Aspergillus candidus]|uniref:separase n=1 Tax=Aspergillus candidus TaxID=41067 RepID=A0A2I2FPV7_ASPCN|nr:peptidase family C50-domain-containing protein [Aspergillus candidus]PLB42649.1 peptidase family C50-domain-containing protein [Aspergillus candidus]